MTDAGARDARVTLVLVPRERFSFTRTSLESIYEHTDGPFRLVCVDGGSPPHVRRYLEAQSRTKGFDLVRTDHYLSPNRARNLGLRHVHTPWIVFIDNDVVVTPGWLPRLVACGDESGADIVSPLLCEGTPVHSVVHCAGGEAGVRVEARAGGSPTRHIIEKIYRQGQRLSDVRGELKREPTGLAEFHCMLVRASVLERLGGLDERMLNTKEHVDLCMTVSVAGGTIYFEPSSVVTYVPGPPLAWSDMPFYMLRWSDAWELASLEHLQKKWHLAEDTYFIRRYQSVGGRRRVTIVRPLVNALRLRRFTPRAEDRLIRVDRVLNAYLTWRYARRHLAAAG